MENKAKTDKLWKCQECEYLSEQGDLITLYECNNCGTVFSADNSYDGAGNRCPDCGKFAAKKTREGCPECDEGECDEVDAVYDEAAGEMVEVVIETPTEQEVKVHYHAVHYTPGNGAQVNLAIYESIEEMLEFWRHPSNTTVENPDGSFTQYTDREHTKKIADIKFVECTRHVKDQPLEYHQIIPAK